ncbi:cytochrome P450 52A12 [Lentithecium fluviatile CBS 122367]|uniref:Cytochrome P450 52A12 n=1 Tax=Lentithecium fluviatile CBS 122367 TaxID=1168545 RepID=A0A6G1J6P0_9PLEO|nr:cytochrome P450 52A12 [Lentithecium fluviatile CBS 122367]
MRTPLVAALWAATAFVLYKVIVYILNELRHSRNARRLGCRQPIPVRNVDLLGIRNIIGVSKAFKDQRLIQYLKSLMDDAAEREGWKVGTLYNNLLGNPVIFTSEPKNVQAVLATQFKDFGLGDARNGNFAPLLGRGIFASDGAHWEHSRALLRPQFARNQVSDLDLEERHVQHLMRNLPVGTAGWTAVTDIVPLFFRLTLDSATEFLFGEPVDSQIYNLPGYVSTRKPMAVSEKEFSASFDQAQLAIARAGSFGNFYWLRHTKELMEHCRRCHAFIDHYVQIALSKDKSLATQRTAGGKQKYVFLDALAESTRDPIELRSQLINILLAGRDTTASLLSFVFMTFTKHPEVYGKLRSVILEKFGTCTNPREITFENLKACSYLQWVLNETLRLYPVVPLDGRRALVDTTLPTGGGPDGQSRIHIRKGQQVDYSVYVMHRRKDLWGVDAEEFKPERWEGRRGGWDYLPFNGGPRICIGQQFALTEAGYVIVRLLQRFEGVEGVGNTWQPVEKGGMGFERFGLSLTMCPADGVKVRLREARE